MDTIKFLLVIATALINVAFAGSLSPIGGGFNAAAPPAIGTTTPNAITGTVITGTSGDVNLGSSFISQNNTQPAFLLYKPNAPAAQKYWKLYSTDNTLNLLAENDNGTAGSGITLTRNQQFMSSLSIYTNDGVNHTLTMNSSGITYTGNISITSGYGISVSTGTIAAGGGLSTGLSTALVTSSVAMNNGAGAGAGTITNAPAAGNPTKWIPINDGGVTRYIPAW